MIRNYKFFEMDYTMFFLFGMGFLGMLLQFLIKLDSLNRESDGEIVWAKFFILERFSILISFIVVIVTTLLSQEIKQLELAGKWIGFGSFAIGYMAQSILIKFMNKADSFIDRQNNT